MYSHQARRPTHCICHSVAQTIPTHAHGHNWQHRRPLVQSQKGRDNIGGMYIPLCKCALTCARISSSILELSAGIIEEEDDTSLVEETYRQAYRNSQADTICVPGLQEFAGSVSTCKLLLQKSCCCLCRCKYPLCLILGTSSA